MFKNYLKTAWRSIRQNRTFSVINICGLATGLTCCLLISMYLFKEFSYDKQHQLGNRLYQLETLSIIDGKEVRGAGTSAPMAPAMQEESVQSYAVKRLGSFVKSGIKWFEKCPCMTIQCIDY